MTSLFQQSFITKIFNNFKEVSYQYFLYKMLNIMLLMSL